MTQAFSKFVKGFLMYLSELRLGQTEDYGSPGGIFARVLDKAIEECHMFEIPNEVRDMLTLTDAPKMNSKIRLPFKEMFFDVEFDRARLEELGITIKHPKVVGILVVEHKYTNEDPYVMTRMIKITDTIGLRMFACCIKENGDYFFEVFNFLLDDDKRAIVQELPNSDKMLKSFLRSFIINALNLINDPEIEWKVMERDGRNEARERKGKIPFPPRHIIKIEGKIKRYIGQISEMGGWKYSHRFWVRGHFRTLHAERFGENIGRRIWIAPFIKGEGILIKKDYRIEEGKKEGYSTEESQGI